MIWAGNDFLTFQMRFEGFHGLVVSFGDMRNFAACFCEYLIIDAISMLEIS